MEIIKVNKLKKYYQLGSDITKALDGVTFTINEGEFISVIGTSGSGKSTLLNIIGGLDTPTSGEVFIRDKKISKMSDEDRTIFRRKNIGFVFQNYNLIPILSVYENIVFPIELDGQKNDGKFLEKIIHTLQLDDKIYSMPNELSGGQQQRVAIARALIMKPAIVLADEPTGNLDSKTGNEVMNLLRESSKKFNQTLLMITHNDKISKLADRSIQIEDGKILL